MKPGDTIGIAATARYLTHDQWSFAEKTLLSWGLKIKTSSNLFHPEFQLAGNVIARTNSFIEMWEDPEVKAVLIARGGYGTIHTIDGLLPLLDGRKWVCGYSDVTVLLNALNNIGVCSIHSTMPISFEHATQEALQNLKEALFGNLEVIQWNCNKLPNQTIQGEVVGGNLSVIYSQLGSATQLKSKNKILFLEDVDEMYYHLDRMLMALLRAGVFGGVRAVLIGGFTQMKDNTEAFGFSSNNPWGKSWEDIILERLSHLNVPIVFHFPAGHDNDNRAFYMGRQGNLNIQGEQAVLSWK
ncbi:MAG: LD-carboxypeptidase [Bacteroidota bacterium]